MVTVPTTHTPLNSYDMGTLTTIVNPLEESEDGGLSLYSTVRSFVHHHIFPKTAYTLHIILSIIKELIN